MVTLFILLTGDLWNDIMHQTITAEDDIWLSLLFVFFLTLGHFILLNLFLSVLLRAISKEDKEISNYEKPLYHYSVVELFAGAGGLAIGLEQAGIECTALNEIDKWACETLRRNRPHWNVLEGDIKSAFSLLLKYYDKHYIKAMHNRENLK